MIMSSAARCPAELVGGRAGVGGRHHDPGGPGRRRAWPRSRRASEAPTAPSARQLGDRVGADVVDHALVPGAHQPAHDVGAHPAEPDHPELHQLSLLVWRGSDGSGRWWSCRGAGRGPRPRSARGRCATPSTLPSSTPHWSKELIPQIDPLGEDLVLVERDQLPQHRRRQLAARGSCWSGGCPGRPGAARAPAARPRRRPPAAVLPNASASAWAKQVGHQQVMVLAQLPRSSGRSRSGRWAPGGSPGG